MKKHILSLACVIGCLAVEAVGPKIPCILTFTPSPSSEVTGYWFYWRSTNSPYVDTQRFPIPLTGTSGFDLRVIGIARGQYYTAMSATNATAESDLSPDYFWNYQNPNKPSNQQISNP